MRVSQENICSQLFLCLQHLCWSPSEAALNSVFLAASSKITDLRGNVREGGALDYGACLGKARKDYGKNGHLRGCYFHPMGVPTFPHRHARNGTLQNLLWNLSENVVREFHKI